MTHGPGSIVPLGDVMTNDLLVVDWDYFFPNPMDGGDFEGREDVWLYDWGHRETPIHIDGLWHTRAFGFLKNELPLPKVTEWEEFWDRFRIYKQAPVWVADSNVHAVTVEPPDGGKWDSVWLYDAHHDCGYKSGALPKVIEEDRVTCEDWMIAMGLRGTSLHVRYPEWRRKYAMTAEPAPAIDVDRRVGDEDPPAVEFNSVFICRSGAWVPSWNDHEFEQFFMSCPAGDVTQIDSMPMVRDFNERTATEMVKKTMHLFGKQT